METEVTKAQRVVQAEALARLSGQELNAIDVLSRDNWNSQDFYTTRQVVLSSYEDLVAYRSFLNEVIKNRGLQRRKSEVSHKRCRKE